MRSIGADYDRSVKNSLISYMPKYYENSREVNEIVKVDADELELLYERITDVFNQYFIETATWGLSRWEETFGIPINESKSYEERRGVLKSRLRRYGTSTFEMIKNVAESYLNGEVELIEQNNIYNVNVKFIGKRGIPTNLQDIKDAIRLVTPSHLGVTYEFTYLVWEELDSKSNWNQLDTMTWDALEVFFPGS